MKKLIEEFGKFINRGNVLDMAVGVVVGGAFTTIVTSLVNDIIMPVVGLIIGDIKFEELLIPLGKSAAINLGLFIQNIVTFLITAFVVFLVVKAVNESKDMLAKKEEEEEAPAEPEESAELKTLKAIEEELKKMNKAA
ncbi:MAG: large conductance mechanosensitive channel protein MscL [Erysipelotrichaceae bacterium]|nr:large conductance mechanosensitive channel protein MscL [Erysipelotrichaceae bacterium]